MIRGLRRAEAKLRPNMGSMSEHGFPQRHSEAKSTNELIVFFMAFVGVSFPTNISHNDTTKRSARRNFLCASWPWWESAFPAHISHNDTAKRRVRRNFLNDSWPSWARSEASPKHGDGLHTEHFVIPGRPAPSFPRNIFFSFLPGLW